MGETGEVADLGEDRRRDDRAYTLERLKSLHLRGPRRGGEELRDLPLDADFVYFIVLKCVEVELECNLLGRMFEAAAQHPFAMPRAPRLAFEAQVVAQQERLDPDAVSAHVVGRRMSRPDQVAQSLVQRVRHPDDVNSPARNRRASAIASRRSFLIRSPGFRGVSEGAQTRQANPMPAI